MNTQRSTSDARLVVLGVPSSAGSHNGGQEKAPHALRSAGLVNSLLDRGHGVDDLGDQATERHRPTERVDGVRDVERVVSIARQVAERVAQVRAAGNIPIVLGGDCTITLGVLAGLAEHNDVGLMYFDGDADLNTPDSSDSGVLDSMGMTHLLGDGHPAVAGLGTHRPLLQRDRVVLFGFDPSELDSGQWAKLVGLELHAVPAPYVRADPAGTADAACAWLESRCGSLLVHFDVDALDTGAFPLANFPHFAGLTVHEAAICLARFCRSPRFAGLVITEVNPDHDTQGVLVPALVNVITDALMTDADSGTARDPHRPKG